MDNPVADRIVDLNSLTVTDILRELAGRLKNVTPDRADGAHVYADKDTAVVVVNLANCGGATSQGSSIKVASLGGNLSLRKAGIPSDVDLGFNAWRPARTGEEFDMLVARKANAAEAAEVKQRVEDELKARRRQSARP